MPNSRRLGQLLAVAIVLAVPAFAPAATSAASCAGSSHQLNLSNGAVTPGSGSTSTTFTFSVTYHDNGGCAPSRIVVVVSGLAPFTLGYTSGSLTNGATFQAKVTLPAGTRGYEFEATSGNGNGKRNAALKNVSPATVVVTSPPKPTPKPTTKPAPTPTPTPAPTPRQNPTPTPTPTPRSTVVERPTPSPLPSPTATDRAIAFMARTPDRDDGTGHARGGADAVGPGAGSLDAGAMTASVQTSGHPMPWLVLLVASVAAFFGLIGFALLSSSLADPAPRLRSER